MDNISDASFLDCVSDLEFLVVTLGIPRMFVSEEKMGKVTQCFEIAQWQ
jgi:hypothetical protein